jgi:hypothetical protein
MLRSGNAKKQLEWQKCDMTVSFKPQLSGTGSVAGIWHGDFAASSMARSTHGENARCAGSSGKA